MRIDDLKEVTGIWRIHVIVEGMVDQGLVEVQFGAPAKWCGCLGVPGEGGVASRLSRKRGPRVSPRRLSRAASLLLVAVFTSLSSTSRS